MTEAIPLAELVEALPELYQPIYGHPELSAQPSRITDDRLQTILPAVATLCAHLNRPLRILDIGSAQGYVSLSLAMAGHQVTGIDNLPANVALARRLAAEHPDLNVTFREVDIEVVLAQLQPGTYDLVLGLSVLHHLVHARGAAWVTGLLAGVAPKVAAGLFELATRSEPLHWAPAQPTDEQELLSGFSFVHELARFRTHLSELDRPLLFASNRYWYFGREMGTFESTRLQSHALAGNVHAGTRSYFFGDGKMIKRFRLTGPVAADNRQELAREIEFLTKHGSALGYPERIESGCADHETWLVRESVSGELLLDAIQSGKAYDPARVIRDILQQLAALEQRGLFHNDVTVWNTILKSDGGAILIDYGAISATRANCNWPDDLLQAFIQFVRDVVTRETPRTLPFRRPFISPFSLPMPYRQWLSGVWTATSPDWTFAELLRTFDGTTAVAPNSPVREPAIGLWIGSMEQHIDTLGASLPKLASQIAELQADRQQIIETLVREFASREDALRLRLETVIRDRESELDRLRSATTAREGELTAQLATAATERDGLGHQVTALTAERDALSQRLVMTETQRDRLLASTSWRITAPMRWVAHRIRHAREGVLAWLLVKPGSRPRRVARSSVIGIGKRLKKHPLLLALARMVLRPFPQLARRLQSVVRSAADLPPFEAEPPHPLPRPVYTTPGSLSGLPLPEGERTIYLFVDHTIRCLVNTGVQRVARGMASGLMAAGERLRFVKWDAGARSCVLIDSEERRRLAQWNGPALTDGERGVYPEPGQPAEALSDVAPGQNSWLIVPEVTHITYQPEAVTLDLVTWARMCGLKLGFVFYDDIPLRRPEFAYMAEPHRLYMQQIRLAEIVWPISRWSGDVLRDFWTGYELADEASMPQISPILLPGEIDASEIEAGRGQGRHMILCVGTIEPRKNQIALLDAFNRYLAANPRSDWQLVLVGNIHPAVEAELKAKAGKSIRIAGNIADAELCRLYTDCAFTVFPSTDEGFGLPIVESLAYGKPCICANFGSMGEVAAGGGCEVVDTRDADALYAAVKRLIDDPGRREALAAEARARPVTTWSDYGRAVQRDVDAAARPYDQLGIVYYWVDSVLTFPKNTGIQRVTRQLAKQLLDLGVRLIPVRWDWQSSEMKHVDDAADLEHLAKWNGPLPDQWAAWVDPGNAGSNAWFFLPDLPLNLAPVERLAVMSKVRKAGLRTGAIFYDAIPHKMRDIYPPQFSNAHAEYMKELADYDIVLSISRCSQQDLAKFLEPLAPKARLAASLKVATLPGEFPESPRVIAAPVSEADQALSIVCVGTVELRKNHDGLTAAFQLAQQRCKIPLRLVIAGRATDAPCVPRLRKFVAANPAVEWLENADDSELREIYSQAAFSIYPSIEEGFGLPILESLWYGRPCIAANFGAMAEAADGGGCLLVDVRDPEQLALAIQRLAEDADLRQRLTNEAVNRRFKTWREYALDVVLQMSTVTASARRPTPPRPQVRAVLPSLAHLTPRPRLSVCISTYNRAEWLKVSLANWQRHYPNPRPGVELFVCDNTSTDHTPEVVKPYLARPDFFYHRNIQNVGMLGNLRVTANRAHGQYIWILGDDDLMMKGSIERVLSAIDSPEKPALIYLNYAFTRIEDARTVTDFEAFFRDATPIVPAEPDKRGPIRDICARNENFFTAIYTLVFRRDHAIDAYSQYTGGRPFSTMLTCIPTTYHVLNRMMDEPGVWIGEPQVVVNMNVSWMRYAPLWILERIPEVYEVAEQHGAKPEEVDRWRRHTLPGVREYFREIYQSDPHGNAEYFDPSRLVRRFKHLPEFIAMQPELMRIYARALAEGHPAARRPIEAVFPTSASAEARRRAS